MRKRLLALFMSLCLVVGLLPTAAWAEESSEGTDVALSGSCGDSMSWKLEENNDDLYYTASDDNKIWRFYENDGEGEGRTKAQAYTLTITKATPAITIKAAPAALTVTDSKGSTINVTDKGDGKYSFVMPDSKVDVKATFVKSEVKPGKTVFVDVPENSWYADAADFAAKRGLMSGVGENQFGGGQNTTRGMLMTILAKMDGQDVTGGATWYEKAMIWAKANGVSDGTMPEKNITREQLATMLYSYAKLKGIDTTQGGMAVREFADYDSISGWAGQSMAWAVNAGILSGRENNTLAPTAGATRAEMAVMLQQFVKLTEK